MSVSGWQGEQFILGAMLQVLRLAAGSEWVPPRIRLESPDSQWVLGADGLDNCQVEFGGPVLAVAVPYALLDRPISGRCSVETAEEHLPFARDFVGTLHQAIAPLVLEQSLSIEVGAEIAQTSPRSLCRWLAREGTSWRHVVDRVRFEACARLLLNPALALSEISGQLGYSDQAHFSRAFHRWTGEAPSAYRRRRVS